MRPYEKPLTPPPAFVIRKGYIQQAANLTKEELKNHLQLSAQFAGEQELLPLRKTRPLTINDYLKKLIII